jgi:hypothetical protein
MQVQSALREIDAIVHCVIPLVLLQQEYIIAPVEVQGENLVGRTRAGHRFLWSANGGKILELAPATRHSLESSLDRQWQ